MGGSTKDQKALEDALVLTVHDIFEGSHREELSVNNVRKQCEEKNGLADGLFTSSAEWKAKSKAIIKERVVSLCFLSFFRAQSRHSSKARSED